MLYNWRNGLASRLISSGRSTSGYVLVAEIPSQPQNPFDALIPFGPLGDKDVLDLASGMAPSASSLPCMLVPTPASP
jgi:hypothetical protein